MGVLTLLTDFGYRDHYVAALKARLLQLAPKLPVLDITHGVEPYNIAHAVHVLRAVFRDFPAGTTHLITVSDYGASDAGAVASPAWHAAEHEGHYFVAADNGLLPLLCDGVPAQLVRLPGPVAALAPAVPLAAGNLQPLSLNPTRDILAPAAVRLAQGQPLASLGQPVADLYLLTNRQLRLQDNRITGHVVHVDHYGNLITNISREAVEVVGRGRAAVCNGFRCHRPPLTPRRSTGRAMRPRFGAQGMQRLQTSDPSGHSFALARIASYRSLQAEHHEALSELDKGIRHLDPAPGGFMVDSTERYRQRHLDAIAKLERWVRVWERDLTDPD